MEPELASKVKDWSKTMKPEDAKKLFIRDSAKEAYKTSDEKVREITTEVVKEVIDILTVGKMTRAEIGTHIANLEKARSLLACLGQGFQIAFAEEKEPEFKAKHEREQKEARASKPKTLEDSLSRLGVDFSKLAASLNKPLPVKNEETKTPAPSNKIKCDKCGKEFFSAMKNFHKC